MKTREVWAQVVKFVGVTVLVAMLLLIAAVRNTEKRNYPLGVKASAVPANETLRSTRTEAHPKWTEAYGRLPLSFEENVGQTAREVRYVSHGSGYELFLTPKEVVLALRPDVPLDPSPLRRAATIRALRKARQACQMTVMRMRLEGANPEPQIAGTDRLPTKVNYFIGNDPEKWHTGVPSYARVKYAGIYPGVDAVFYGNERRLEYDFVVAPGTDPRVIALQLDGAREMRINGSGDLVLGVSGGEVELKKPVVYQLVKGERHEISGGYAIAENHRVTFSVGPYDRNEPLILDPVLNYSTYLGGSSTDGGFAIAVDAAGDAFIAGQTMSTDFPAGTHGGVTTAPTGNLGASFVAELNPAGTQLLYSTYLAGSTSNSFEQAFGVAVDSSGMVYVTGLTFAIDFPTTSNGLKFGNNASNVNGTSYITKLDPTKDKVASLLYSSYLGGTNGTAILGGDVGQAIAVDASNPANGITYVAGYTDSTPGTAMSNFPVVNGFQTTLNCPNGNAFLAKIDTTKSGTASLLYSTYLGGTCVNAPAQLLFGEDAFGVAVDASGNGNAYLAGVTSSTDFPTTPTNAFRATVPTGNAKGAGFVTRIDTTKTGGASLIYSTYLGGANFDEALAVGLGPGPTNVVYVTGNTSSTNFPTTTGAFQTTGTGKAFVSLVDTTKSLIPSLQYSTYLGGTGGDTGFGIKSDASGNAYVAGSTSSTDFPTTPSAIQTKLSNPFGDAFITKLNPGGKGAADLLYSTYFGGAGDGNSQHLDQAFGIAVDSSNNAYVTGRTFSSATTFPVFPPATATPPAFQSAKKGASDAFVAKLAVTGFTVTATAPAPVKAGSSVNFTVSVLSRGGFNSAVALTCTGAPPLSTCTPAPASVTPSADGVTPATSTVTVTTTALMVPPPSAPNLPVPMRPILPLLLAVILLFLLPVAKRLRVRLGMVTAMILLIALAGCSGLKKPGTPTGTTNLTITGTSGNLTDSATVALTVN